MGEAPSGYHKLECRNFNTKQVVGYLASNNNYVTLTSDKENGAWVQWRYKDNLTYLAKDTTPNDRFLGLAEQGYGGWGLQGTEWSGPLDYDGDNHTIALRGTTRYLYGPYETLGKAYACWSEEGEKNSNILRCEMVDMG